MAYRLTGRGKLVLSLFILILVANIYISGRYILNYFSSPDQDSGPIVSSKEQSSETVIETSTEAMTENITSTENITTSENKDKIYSVYELDDLRRYKLIIYFDSGSATIDLSSSDMDSLNAIINQYPGERIAIAGHVNGYPNYLDDGKAQDLSLLRANYVRDIFIEMGIEESMISVYNFGLEKPLYKDYGNQDKNDRVEIYFEDHFVNGEGGK